MVVEHVVEGCAFFSHGAQHCRGTCGWSAIGGLNWRRFLGDPNDHDRYSTLGLFIAGSWSRSRNRMHGLLRMRAWPRQASKEGHVVMDTFGRHLCRLHNDSCTLLASWQIMSKNNNFHFASDKFFSGYWIVLTSSCTLFRLELGDMKTNKVYQGCSYGTFSTTTPRGCWVGVPGAKKAMLMDSQQSCMLTCIRPSFHEVVANTIATPPQTDDHDIRGIDSHTLPLSELPSLAPLPLRIFEDTTRLGRRQGKENALLGGPVKPMALKPKRKYVRRQVASTPFALEGVPSQANNITSTASDEAALLAPHPKRKYTRRYPEGTAAEP